MTKTKAPHHFYRPRLLLWVCLIWALGGPALGLAETPPDIKCSLVSNYGAVSPGQTFSLALQIKIPPGWHIYWKTSGDAGLPTQIDLKLPKDIRLTEWKWPRPEIFQEAGGITTIGYANEVLLGAEGVIPKTWPIDNSIEINGTVSWLACKKSCIPGSQEFKTSISVGKDGKLFPEGAALVARAEKHFLALEEEPSILKEYEELKSSMEIVSQIGSAGESKHISPLLALLFAFLGGLLLNIMPCVLPVLSLKAIRIIRQGENAPSENWRQSVLYFAGVMLSFTVLAGLVAGLKWGGQEIGWGFQFQEPRFLIFMTGVVFGFGLTFFGLYEFSFAPPGNLEKITRKESWMGPFGEGLLATLLATPCTAPFLGPAIGFSFSQPGLIIFLFFWMIGFGFAFPFLLLAAVPQWTRYLPKPGRWMETLKKIMGFPLIGTGIWLLWILSRLAPWDAVKGTIMLLGIIALVLWGLSLGAGPGQPAKRKWTLWILGIFLILGAYFRLVEPSLKKIEKLEKGEAAPPILKGGVSWEPFSVEAFKKALDEKTTIFVDFTADWCLTCQLNEKGVLRSPKITAAFREHGVRAFRADWTNRSEHLTQIMRRLGRSGVPVYVYFKNGDAANPIILPEILTEKAVLRPLQDIN